MQQETKSYICDSPYSKFSMISMILYDFIEGSDIKIYEELVQQLKKMLLLKLKTYQIFR